MRTFEKAGKAADEFIEKTIEATEEIAVKAVDVADELVEIVMGLPHNVKQHRQQADSPRTGSKKMGTGRRKSKS